MSSPKGMVMCQESRPQLGMALARLAAVVGLLQATATHVLQTPQTSARTRAGAGAGKSDRILHPNTHTEYSERNKNPFGFCNRKPIWVLYRKNTILKSL